MPRRPLTPLDESHRRAQLAALKLDQNMLPLSLTPTERQNLVPTEIKAGLSTSEGKFAIALFVIGLALETVAIPLFERIGAMHPQWVWVPILLALLGAMLQVATFLGYQRGRTALKVAALGSGRASEATVDARP